MNRHIAAAMVTGHLTPIFTNGDSLCSVCAVCVDRMGWDSEMSQRRFFFRQYAKSRHIIYKKIQNEND